MSFIIIFAIVLIAFIINLSSKQKKQKAVKIIKNANIELELENYSKAIYFYEKAILIDNKNYILYYNHGLANLAIGKYQNSIDSFSQAISLNRNFNPAYLQRAFSYIQLRDYKKALDDCNQISYAENVSTGLDVNLVRGTIFIHLGKYQRALDEFNKSLKSNSDFFLVHSCRAEAYCYLGRYNQALESLQKSFAINPDFYMNYLWKSWANYGISNYEEALEDCNYFFEHNNYGEESPKAYEIRALIYKAQNRIDDSLADLEKAYRLYKNQKVPKIHCDEIVKHIRQIKGKNINEIT